MNTRLNRRNFAGFVPRKGGQLHAGFAAAADVFCVGVEVAKSCRIKMRSATYVPGSFSSTA